MFKKKKNKVLEFHSPCLMKTCWAENFPKHKNGNDENGKIGANITSSYQCFEMIMIS